jgi:putative membrane-bound dehydrogenase-like protein
MFRYSLLALMLASPAFAQREYGFDNTKPSGQPYLAPEESLRRMKIADGFEIHLAAAEPTIINPIAFTIDEKGRLWVVECFEYPKRTPKGKMPRDRIVILESTKSDGVYDKRTVFAEGKDFPMSFDMASGIEVGHGGVFLGAPPYLWFIENKNDKPGKFEVLLKGFGSQDTHETLNTFQWGPDGWLYGLHGVFTSSEVVSGEPPALAEGGSGGAKTPPANAGGSPNAIKLNAGVWRYHPKTKKFEVFAEGTSNPWGMDWRNTDGEFILCCCVIPHLYHIVPGGVYRRQAGASFNPYAYGEIKEICDHTFHKESGWAHAGLISLDAPHIPEKWRNSVIFGSIHGCSVKQNILKRNGSSFIASRGDDFLVSGDKNFRPINMKWGPGGDIYLIDWHDQNPCHQAKPDAWDYEHGRIFRISVNGSKLPHVNLRSMGPEDLLAKFGDPDPYLNRQALRLAYERFADRPIPAINTPKLRRWEELRGLYAIGNELTFKSGIVHGEASLALAWLARFAANRGTLSDAEIADMASAVKWFPDSTVRSDPVSRREFASAALRVADTKDVRQLLHDLMWSPEDSNDPLIPHLVWLAYEKTLARATDAVLDAELAWLVEESYPKVLTPDRIIVNYMVMDYILPRVMRRLASSGRPQDLARCLAALEKMTDDYVRVRRKALAGLTTALKDRLVDEPANWKAVRPKLLEHADAEGRRYVELLAVSFRDPEAMKRAYAIVHDASRSAEERAEAVRQIALLKHPEAASTLFSMTRQEPVLAVRVEAMRSLALLNDPNTPKNVLESWPKYPPEVRAEAANLLASRKEWARPLLDAVGAKKVARQDLTDNTILRIRSFNDASLNKRIEEVWGKFRATPKELEALINKMRTSLYEGPASFAHGKQVFEQHCVKCHKFEGRGAEVGPQLDGAARDIEYLLANILDPNRVIGQPYFVHVIERKNGTSEVGLLAAEDPQTITLKVENAVTKVIPKSEIESHQVQEKSLMPEGLAAGMTQQDFRDLLRYVMANPFINHVTLNGKPLTVGTPGRIPLPQGDSTLAAEMTAPAAMKTKLQLGGSADVEVKLNGKVVYAGKPGEDRPDVASADVELAAGANRLEVHSKSKGSLYARFLDPDRKLKYPE